jgi:hypothetical protein
MMLGAVEKIVVDGFAQQHGASELPRKLVTTLVLLSFVPPLVVVFHLVHQRIYYLLG